MESDLLLLAVYSSASWPRWLGGRWWRDGGSAGPQQLGYGIRNGAEAAVHIVRMYLSNSMRNAFNLILWDKILEAVQTLSPIGIVSPFSGENTVFGDHGWQTQVPSLT